MGMHETIIFIHIYMSTHIHVYTDTCTNIYRYINKVPPPPPTCLALLCPQSFSLSKESPWWPGGKVSRLDSNRLRIEPCFARGAFHRPWPVRNSSVSSVLGSLSCTMQCHGFDPPLSLLGVNMSSDSIPPKLLDMSINRGFSLCTHAFYHLGSKDPDVHAPDG